MSFYTIKRHKFTNMIHVIKNGTDLVGVYYFLNDAIRDYPNALDYTGELDQ